MYQEVAALRMLAGHGTPRVLESKVDSWEEEGTPLYVIMQWVDGPTLSQHLASGPRPRDEAITIACQLAEILERCHDVGIQHRDLKPDNIILDHGDVNNPVVVDFGMSWSRTDEEQARGFNTPAHQELGNRFLRLPEHAPGAPRHDFRSDVTMLIGILFFLLTGKAPRVLVDERGRLPHERPAAIPVEVERHPLWQLIRRTFRVGFQQEIDLRFASAKQLKDLLSTPLKVTERSELVEEEVEKLLELMQSGANKRQVLANERISLLCRLLWNRVLRALGPDLGPQLASSTSGRAPMVNAAAMGCAISRQDLAGPQASFEQQVTLQGGDLIATYRLEGGDWEEYYRGPVSDFDGQEAAVDVAAARLASRLAAIFRGKLGRHLENSDSRPAT